MSESIDEFFNEVRQGVLAGSAANKDFALTEFLTLFDRELTDSGAIEGIEHCHYRNSGLGVRVDGFWKNDDEGLDLFIVDYEGRAKVETLTNTDIGQLYKRLSKFYLQCQSEKFYSALEETSPVYGLAREIFESSEDFGRVNLYLLSERRISDHFKQNEITTQISSVPVAFHIWDVSRLHRLKTSRGSKEPIDINLSEFGADPIPCLSAHLDVEQYQSYLLVMPAELLANLYARYGSRLLEQNVRSFLQARGAVNKGIRDTIVDSPEMFFAYNNGITATAADVELAETERGARITRIRDLQIVNGGQTTASLFHARRKDKADLSRIFVQVKLSIVDAQLSEIVVPKISEYANTQNRVNAADFFSNHLYHVRMEEFSRRLWAPALEGSQRETKWFYERARGQFADAQAKLTPADKRRFLAEYPKNQMFTKTDLAKYENVWDDHPRFVNLGAQKNFARFADRISDEWKKDSEKFGETYFRGVIARAIIFKATERIVSSQPWYGNGYRANTVAYTLALLGLCARQLKKEIDLQLVWQRQSVDPAFVEAVCSVGRLVQADLMAPPEKISNISEWAKREACWERISMQADRAVGLLSPNFSSLLK